MEERYLDLLREAEKGSGDPEGWHCYAESVMLKLLREVGFNKFADEYARQSKNWWYA